MKTLVMWVLVLMVIACTINVFGHSFFPSFMEVMHALMEM
jgi:hypothetical protein